MKHRTQRTWIVINGQDIFGVVCAPNQREAARIYADYIGESFESFEHAWQAVREDVADGNLVIEEAQFDLE